MSKTVIHAVALSFSLTAVGFSLIAAEPSVEERLKKLEGVVDSLQKENTQLRKELGYDPKGVAGWLKPAGKPNKVTLGGFIQGQAEFGEAPDARYNGIEDRIYVRRARLNIQGSFLEYFDFKAEADFGANSISERGGITPQLTDGYLNWNRYEFANVRAGQFKTPYGYEQLAADTKIPLVERSLPNDRLTEGRQLGAAVSGAVLEKRLGYMAGLFNGTAANTSSNDNDNFLYAARVHGIPLKVPVGNSDLVWSLGVNGFTSNDRGSTKYFGTFTGERLAWGADTQVKWGPVEVNAEYLNSYFNPTVGASFHGQGLALLAAYMILPKQLQGVVRYETFDPMTNVSGDSTDVWTFGLNYFIKGDDLKLSVNYLIGDRAAAAGFPANDNEGRLLIRAQVVF